MCDTVVFSRMHQVEGVQPLATPDDCFDAEAIAKADPQVNSSSELSLRALSC